MTDIEKMTVESRHTMSNDELLSKLSELKKAVSYELKQHLFKNKKGDVNLALTYINLLNIEQVVRLKEVKGK
jgi:hypothetical protein